MKLCIWWPTYGNFIRMGGATSRMGGATSFPYPALPSRFKTLLYATGPYTGPVLADFTHDGRVFTAHMTVACSLHTWRSLVHCTRDGRVFTVAVALGVNIKCSLHTWRSRVYCRCGIRGKHQVFTAHMTVACSLHTWRTRIYFTHDGHAFTSHMTDACSVQWRCGLRWATSHLQCWDLPMMLTKDEDIYLYIDQRWSMYYIIYLYK